MTPSQILLSALIIFIIVRTFIAYKKGNFSESFFAVWLLFWLGTIILIFQQQLVIDLAHKIGISRGVDLVIYISLIIIFYSIYRIMVWMNELESKLTKLVRKIALKDKEKVSPERRK